MVFTVSTAFPYNIAFSCSTLKVYLNVYGEGAYMPILANQWVHVHNSWLVYISLHTSWEDWWGGGGGTNIMSWMSITADQTSILEKRTTSWYYDSLLAAMGTHWSL